MRSCTGLGGLIQKRSLSFLKPPDLHKRNWKKDVVYLYQFKRSPVMPNLSPFCMKVETYLRANKINYEPLGSWTIRSKEGRVPFIELNGKQIADSQLILWHLEKHFKINEGLNPEQAGIARAVDRMMEGSSYYAITYFRSIEGAYNSANPNVSGLPVPAFLTSFFGKKILQNAQKRLSSEGIARHNRETIIEILRRDVQAVDQILGDKRFIIGVQPTIPDFSVFGHLGVGYFLPFRQPIQDLLDEEFPRVRQLLERTRLNYYPDWPKKSNTN